MEGRGSIDFYISNVSGPAELCCPPARPPPLGTLCCSSRLSDGHSEKNSGSPGVVLLIRHEHEAVRTSVSSDVNTQLCILLILV